MVLPISCNECRRRKIRCDRVQPCKNCSHRCIPCSYPSKFRSIEINKLKPTAEASLGIDYYKSKVKELETKLAVSEDLISIFDSTGNSASKYFGQNSITSLESEMMNGILPFQKDVQRAINLKKKNFPVIIDDDNEKNKKTIRSLVEFFFKEDQYYYFNEMIDKKRLFYFLDNYDVLEEWSNDEDIMLLCCILIDVLKNCLGNREPSIIPNQPEKIKNLITYYFHISKIQTRESEKFIQSQLILMNYYYFIYSFEKCWKLISQIVSNAYSIGLHIKGGVLWTKINTMEALICSASSRPNLINGCEYTIDQERDLDDELQEHRFCRILREKNGLYVSSYINKNSMDYMKLLKVDEEYDKYNLFLLSMIIIDNKGVNPEIEKQNEKINILLLMSYGTQIKIHYELFEHDHGSDKKVMELSANYISTLENFAYGKLNTLRDKFSALECFFYQFLLIFLKYLNFKSVGSMIKKSKTSLDKILNHSDEEIQQLILLQKRLIDTVGKNSLSNPRLMKVVDIIKSIDLGQVTANTLIANKYGQFYVTDEMKGLLEDPVYDVLKSVTDFPTINSNFLDKNYTLI